MMRSIDLAKGDVVHSQIACSAKGKDENQLQFKTNHEASMITMWMIKSNRCCLVFFFEWHQIMRHRENILS